MKIIPTLSFDGNAEDAMEFYARALGGEISGIMRYKDMPGAEASPETADKVLHAELLFAGNAIYFSDSFFDEGVRAGNLLGINLDCESEEQVTALYDGLMKGARNIRMEPQDTFWGAFYAEVTDKYGVGWSFNFQRDNLMNSSGE